MKILAVEDDPVASLVLEGALRSLGHEVTLLPDAEGARAEIESADIRVVVSDWHLPGITGLELCQRLRQRTGAYVYFILLSQQSATEQNQQAALEAGVDDFLTKPVVLRELKMRLHVAERILAFTSQVRQLESFLPICGYCKKIRDDRNYWQALESYLHEHTGTQFSHGICPECFDSQMAALRALDVDAAAPAPRRPPVAHGISPA